MNKIKKILEEFNLASSNIDEENKVIKEVVVLNKTSKNSRLFTDKALNSGVAIFEGAPSFDMHLTLEEQKRTGSKSRSVRQKLLGSWSNLKVKEGKLLGDFHSLTEHWDFMKDIATRMPGVCGFSINSDAKCLPGNDEYNLIVEEFIKTNDRATIDLVSAPGSTKGLFEEENLENTNMDDILKLQEENKGLKEKIEKLMKEGVDSQIKVLQEENRQYKEKFEQIEKEKTFRKQLNKVMEEMKINQAIITPVFEEVLVGCNDIEYAKKLLTDRVKVIKESSLPATIKLKNGGGDGNPIDNIKKHIGAK